MRPLPLARRCTEPPIQQFGMPTDPTALGGGWFHEIEEPSEAMECEPCEMDDE